MRVATVAALAMVALACGPTGTPAAAAPNFGIDPAAVVDVGTAGLAPQVGVDGRVSIVAIRWQDGTWVISPLSSSPGQKDTDSLHLITYSGETGEAWNTFVFGTAAPGTDRVELEGFPDQRGGRTFDGAWVIALREKDVHPADMNWTFIDADGSERSGTGIFPPDT